MQAAFADRVGTESHRHCLGSVGLPEDGLVVRLLTATEVAECLRLVRGHKGWVYPTSTGRNWGYGTATPPRSDGLRLDLSGMTRITGFDDDLGVVTVEPGVTQQQLADFLAASGSHWLCPTTGAGPDAGILGNAMERGYGLTPHTDHFQAVQSLEAVLADGTRYRSAMAEATGPNGAGSLFRWGVGPYLDGIFTQSKAAVVTSVTIALASKAPRTVALLGQVQERKHLEPLVHAVRGLLRTHGHAIGGINLMNDRRVLAMSLGRSPAPAGQALSDQDVRELCREHRVARWTVMGHAAGPRAVVADASRAFRRALRGVSRLNVSLSRPQAATLARGLSTIPLKTAQVQSERLHQLAQALEILEGQPNRVALPLAYWRCVNPENATSPSDPARDGVGLIWYSPLVPMRPETVRRFVQSTEEVCLAHCLDPLITLTSLSNRCFDSTVPLLFNPKDDAQASAARACYEALLETHQPMGIVPYRLPLFAQGRWAKWAPVAFQAARRIVTALDPDDSIAPGRYGLEAMNSPEFADHRISTKAAA